MVEYGQRFLDSFAERVDKNIHLIVYAEDCWPDNPDPLQIIIKDQKEVPKLIAFKERWKDVPKANGKCPWPERRPRDHHKEFKWHAIRFANKTYAVFQEALDPVINWLVWIDADTFVHSNWSYEQIKDLLPRDKWITFVGRGVGTQTWPECGFYGLNVKDRMCKQFLEEFERYYEEAEDGIFKLEEWHDSFVFGHILNQMKIKYPNVLDYSANIYNRTAKTGGGGHPLINSVLGTWLDHMKGVRKSEGSSRKKDLLVPRNEKYWNEV
jgi:hypothetical protein